MIFCIVLAVILVFPSEACQTIPIFEPKHQCPIGGETSTGITCVGINNVVKTLYYSDNVLARVQ